MKPSFYSNKYPHRPRVLIAPLDWGLGHATRCIPIINELIKLNCEVFIAADQPILSLLKKEYPNIVFLRLEGYRIKYSHKKSQLLFRILLQIPKTIFSIWKENRWINKKVEQHQIHAVISDNRFGLYSKKVPCIYITHQLFIKTGNIFTEKIAQKIHCHFIKKYHACWVPDFKENGLAGKLSHPGKVPSNVVYTGPLSRFHQMPAEKIIDLLISISGPEPQRTIFENMILKQLENFNGKVLMVRGLPSESKILPSSNESVKLVNHLSAEEFNKALAQSHMVVSRSGYTTIMDLVKLQKKAILIPTPGQTEQEYLAQYLSQKKYFYSVDQPAFSLNKDLKHAASFPYICFDEDLETYKNVINEFVLSLKTGNFASQ